MQRWKRRRDVRPTRRPAGAKSRDGLEGNPRARPDVLAAVRARLSSVTLPGIWGGVLAVAAGASMMGDR